MKFASTKKTPQPSTPRTHPCCVPEIERANFFAHIAKMVGRKPFHFGLHLSPTLVDMWCTGEKRDVFSAARQACRIVREEGRADLVPVILEYISDDFGGRILTPEETKKLTDLARKEAGNA